MGRNYRHKIFLAAGAGILALLAVLLAAWWLLKPGEGPAAGTEPQPQTQGYAGSASCRECHEKFYQLWSGSHHGLAMQPVTAEFLRTQLVPQTSELQIKEYRYRAEIRDGRGWVLESGPRGAAKHPMEHALGGKNVYYFLTPLEQGRLQVLPLAFDVRQKEWFDTTATPISRESATSTTSTWPPWRTGIFTPMPGIWGRTSP